MQERAATRRLHWWATIASGTVLMPTASAPSFPCFDFGRGFIIGPSRRNKRRCGVWFLFHGPPIAGFSEGGVIGPEIHNRSRPAVLATQRIVAHEIQVIPKASEIAGFVFAIDSPGGVGEQKDLMPYQRALGWAG